MSRIDEVVESANSVSIEDFCAVLGVLSHAAAEGVARLDRVRRFCDGLTRIIDGDTWMWWYGRHGPSATTYQVIDGGYTGADQKKCFHAWATLPELHSVWTTVISNRLICHTTYLHSELLQDPDWVEGIEWRTLREQTGLRDFVMTMHPMEDGTCMALGIHRRVSKPDFTHREKSLVDMVTREWTMLHDAGRETPAEAKISTLSPRLKQVLMHVLSGNSRKEIARNLSLSEHTVGGYLKELHTRLNVNSRAELMARFMPGAELPPMADE